MELRLFHDQFLVPVGYEEYLSKEYGDYMTPPPEEKREHHYTVPLHSNEMGDAWSLLQESSCINYL